MCNAKCAALPVTLHVTAMTLVTVLMFQRSRALLQPAVHGSGCCGCGRGMVDSCVQHQHVSLHFIF